MRNEKFEVKIKEEFGKPALSITTNGSQWISIIIRDAENEIPLIINALQRYLSSNKPVEPIADICNCINGIPQTTGGCPIHGVKY